MIAIVAKSLNNVIGLNGELPWKCSEDLKFFKAITMNKKILVGYNTFKKLPELNGRDICVLTTKMVAYMRRVKKLYHSIDEVPDNIIVCGGASIYDQLIKKCTHVFVTTIKQEVEGDTFFKDSWLDGFRCILQEDKQTCRIEMWHNTKLAEKNGVPAETVKL